MRPYILKGKVEEDFGSINLTVSWIGFLDKYKREWFLGYCKSSTIYIFLKRSIPISGGQFNLIGIKKVPTPFVIKVHLLSVSLMRPEEPLYFMEQGIHGAQFAIGNLIWPPWVCPDKTSLTLSSPLS
jgi:hypothetical protein